MEINKTFFNTIRSNCYSKFSLEGITVIQIVSDLWHRQGQKISHFNRNFYENFTTEKWKNMADEVNKEIEQLPLPRTIKCNLLHHVDRIARQIINWMRFQHLIPYFDDIIQIKFCWTPQGWINEKKTAEKLCADPNLDIFTRYHISCLACLEDEIPKLWVQVPEPKKTSFLKSIEDNFLNIYLFLWADDRLLDRTLTERKFMTRFHFGFSIGSISATKYFYFKLTTDQKRKGLFTYAHTHIINFNPEVLCFLISVMDTELQMGFFNQYAHIVLRHFEKWPWYDYFIETSDYLRPALSQRLCHEVLNVMSVFLKYVKDPYFKILLITFWLNSPISDRQYAITRKDLLKKLLIAEDEDLVQIVLNDARGEDKEDFVRSSGPYICWELLKSDKWNGIKIFLQELLETETEVIDFKRAFQACNEREGFIFYTQSYVMELDRVFSMIDDEVLKKKKLFVE